MRKKFLKRGDYLVIRKNWFCHLSETSIMSINAFKLLLFRLRSFYFDWRYLYKIERLFRSFFGKISHTYWTEFFRFLTWILYIFINFRLFWDLYIYFCCMSLMIFCSFNRFRTDRLFNVLLNAHIFRLIVKRSYTYSLFLLNFRSL